MSDIKTAVEAEQALHRASCIVLSLEQLIRHTQCEEPFCGAAVSETLTVAYEQIIDVMGYLEMVSPQGSRGESNEAENA
jgi:hypothetical protein